MKLDFRAGFYGLLLLDWIGATICGFHFGYSAATYGAILTVGSCCAAIVSFCCGAIFRSDKLIAPLAIALCLMAYFCLFAIMSEVAIWTAMLPGLLCIAGWVLLAVISIVSLLVCALTLRDI